MSFYVFFYKARYRIYIYTIKHYFKIKYIWRFVLLIEKKRYNLVQIDSQLSEASNHENDEMTKISTFCRAERASFWNDVSTSTLHCLRILRCIQTKGNAVSRIVAAKWFPAVVSSFANLQWIHSCLNDTAIHIAILDFCMVLKSGLRGKMTLQKMSITSLLETA